MTAIISMFLHLDVWHVVGNMVFLWFFGAVLEDRIGRLQFAGIYLITGFASYGLYLAFCYIFRPEAAYISGVGASGALYGVMGVFLCRCYFRKVSMFTMLLGIWPALIKVRAWALILLFFAMDIYWGVKQAQGFPIHIAHWAHIGGMLAGVGLALAVGYRKRGRIENYRETAEKIAKEGTALGEAQKCFEKIVELDPGDFEAMTSLGELLSRFSPTPKGESYYRKAITKSFEAGNKNRAIDIYMRYITRYHGVFPIRMQMELTKGFIARNRLHLAALGLERWIQLNPCSGMRKTAAKALASIYRRMGAIDLAEKTLKQAEQPLSNEKTPAPAEAIPSAVTSPARA